MQLAIVGLAHSGKTTVFDALTAGHVPTGAYTGDADLHVGTFKVPDDRLDKLGALFNEYHALLVRHAKVACRKVPRCEDCPLLTSCPTGQARPQASAV